MLRPKIRPFFVEELHTCCVKGIVFELTMVKHCLECLTDLSLETKTKENMENSNRNKNLW